jgi:two-component system phosphate regulon sensor histidine kinase PhoR
MIFLAFFLGLIIGIGFWYLRQRAFNQQLRKTLKSLPNRADEESSLPTAARLRQKMTRLHQQCQQLEGELQTQQQLLDNAPIGYLQVDEENRLIWCNWQARQLLKIHRWQPGQVRLLLELVRSFELDQLIEQTRDSQHSQTQEWVFHTTEVPTESQNQRLSPRGHAAQSLTLKGSSCPLPQGQVGVFLENQQPLVELSQSCDRAFSDLTHELRTPLTSIRLVAEALQGRLQPPESRWVKQMLQESHRLIHLVEDWLEISRLEKNSSQHLNLQSLNLRELIISAWETLQPVAKQKEISLAYSGVRSLRLQADESRLTQVFLNLFDNAIKHSPPQAEVLVEAHAPENEDRVHINIIDSGEGFSEADLGHVFDRLYRGDASRQQYPRDSEALEALPAHSGSGLGLSIVQQILRAHGGAIAAQNHSETGGAWLQIALPIASFQTEDQGSQENTETRGRGDAGTQ